MLARLYGRLYGHDCTDSCSSYQRLFGLKSTTSGTVRPARVSQVTIRLGDAPTHIRRTVSDPLSEAVLRPAINVVAARRTAWRRRSCRPDRARTAHHARRALRQRLVGGEPDWLGEARPASCRARRRPLNVAASRHAAPAVADWTQYDWRRERCCALRLWIHGCSSCSAHGSRRRPPTAPQGAPVPLRADCPARCACTPEPEALSLASRVYTASDRAASPHLRRAARVSSKRWQARRWIWPTTRAVSK